MLPTHTRLHSSHGRQTEREEAETCMYVFHSKMCVVGCMVVVSALQHCAPCYWVFPQRGHPKVRTGGREPSNWDGWMDGCQAAVLGVCVCVRAEQSRELAEGIRDDIVQQLQETVKNHQTVFKKVTD